MPTYLFQCSNGCEFEQHVSIHATKPAKHKCPSGKMGKLTQVFTPPAIDKSGLSHAHHH